VELLRGPTSALYGANATGGIVSMTTKAPRYSPGGQLRLTAGEKSTAAADFRWAGKLGQAGIVLAVLGRLLVMADFYAVVGWLVFLLGLLLFAVASTRAGLGTGPGLWLWLIGSAFAFITTYMGWPMLVALGVFISGCGQIWLGCSARCERPALRKTSGPEVTAAAR
jgi:hypothetical protein